MPITSIGSACFASPHTTHTYLSLKNLLPVPVITKNLISVSQFAKDNKVYFEFRADKCFIKNQANSEVVLQGVLNNDGLYTFFSIQLSQGSAVSINTTSKAFTSVPSSTSTSSCSPYLMWHNILGYPNHEALKAILQLCNISIPHRTLLDFCSPYCLGKIHRLLPITPSHTLYTRTFDLLFVDVWGPAPVMSSCGYKYLLTCVNAHSKYT